jgi:3'-phosphoadenosine 5'-phosphosulfate sulfotransferase (PAPS reductase)/FAD synthetase
MPVTYGGITFDENGVCSLCREHAADAEQQPPGLEALAQRVRSLTNGGPYDCVIPLSGGKDSTYILYSAVRVLGLTALAVNYDSGFQSEEGRANARSACDELGVELIVSRPDGETQRTMLREILEVSRELDCFTRTCTNCELMLRHAALDVAREHDVPVVLWGSASAESAEQRLYEEYRYGRSPGAILASKLETLTRLRLTPAKIVRLVPHIVRYTTLNIRQRARMGVPWSCVVNPFGLIPFPETDPAVIHFFDYITWDPTQITDTLVREVGWCHPGDRESRFDCRLYVFVEHRHLKLTGITDSGAVSCMHVRRGRMSREKALERELKTQDRIRGECGELARALGLDGLWIDLPHPESH